MGAEDDHLALVGKRPHERFEHASGGHVEAGERLVEDHKAGIVKNGGGDENFLPHPFRVRRQGLVPIVVNAEELQKPIDFIVERGLRKEPETTDQPQVFGAGQIGIEVRFLGHITDSCFVA